MKQKYSLSTLQFTEDVLQLMAKNMSLYVFPLISFYGYISYRKWVFLIQVPSKYRDIDISHMKLFENIE
jgi:hypothetical protein